MKRFLSMATLAACVAAPWVAMAAGDATVGQAIFHSKCALCHSVAAGQNRVGPSLFGVVGRKAGSVPGFNYSEANKNSGKTWDEATLDNYLTNPKAAVPGTKMIFPGLPEAADRANVIAYLVTLK
jgi:cytochrome c